VSFGKLLLTFRTIISSLSPTTTISVQTVFFVAADLARMFHSVRVTIVTVEVGFPTGAISGSVPPLSLILLAQEI
jgi:hypothetical protein